VCVWLEDDPFCDPPPSFWDLSYAKSRYLCRGDFLKEACRQIPGLRSFFYFSGSFFGELGLCCFLGFFCLVGVSWGVCGGGGGGVVFWGWGGGGFFSKDAPPFFHIRPEIFFRLFAIFKWNSFTRDMFPGFFFMEAVKISDLDWRFFPFFFAEIRPPLPPLSLLTALFDD